MILWIYSDIYFFRRDPFLKQAIVCQPWIRQSSYWNLIVGVDERFNNTFWSEFSAESGEVDGSAMYASRDSIVDSGSGEEEGSCHDPWGGPAPWPLTQSCQLSGPAIPYTICCGRPVTAGKCACHCGDGTGPLMDGAGRGESSRLRPILKVWSQKCRCHKGSQSWQGTASILRPWVCGLQEAWVELGRVSSGRPEGLVGPIYLA